MNKEVATIICHTATPARRQAKTSCFFNNILLSLLRTMIKLFYHEQYISIAVLVFLFIILIFDDLLISKTNKSGGGGDCLLRMGEGECPTL